MSPTNGFYRRPRGWRDAAVFDLEPSSTREAWDWLCEHVAYAPHGVTWAGRPCTLRPGELMVTEGRLAETWGWSRAKVRGFLTRLQAVGWVGLEAARVGTRLTLCEPKQAALLERKGGRARGRRSKKDGIDGRRFQEKQG